MSRIRPPAKPTPTQFVIETLEVAAARLRMSPDALRVRCRRALRDARDLAHDHGKPLPPRVDLGNGIVAFKVGRIWRVRFPRQIVGEKAA